MAPTVLAHPDFSKDQLTPAHKLRKPMVEKLRRDRINTSIEQLKALLGPEFLRQQPDSKQEKADILEMAVAHLSGWQQLRQRAAAAAAAQVTASDGYARCVQEAVGFLSRDRVRTQAGTQVCTQAHRRLLTHFLKLQGSGGPGALSPPGSPAHHLGSAGKGLSPASGGIWRPW